MHLAQLLKKINSERFPKWISLLECLFPLEEKFYKNPEMTRTHITSKALLAAILLLGLVASNTVFAAEKYRVSVQVYRLGELIASPVMLVEEGETSGGTVSIPGEAQYKFVVLVRPVADDQVSISLEWTSGKITLQPNLLVDIGKETSVTIDQSRMVLLVERADSISESQTLTGSSWWVEDIAAKGVIDMSHTTIEFTEDGQVAGDSSCNRYVGAVEITGSSMKVGNLAGTRKMCPPAQMDQERSFFQAMAKVTSWEIAETGLLYLRDAGGVDLLRASKIKYQ